jgi:hypothetical protein
VVSAGISRERRSESTCVGAVMVRVIRLGNGKKCQRFCTLNLTHRQKKRWEGRTNMVEYIGATQRLLAHGLGSVSSSTAAEEVKSKLTKKSRDESGRRGGGAKGRRRRMREEGGRRESSRNGNRKGNGGGGKRKERKKRGCDMICHNQRRGEEAGRRRSGDIIGKVEVDFVYFCGGRSGA